MKKAILVLFASAMLMGCSSERNYVVRMYTTAGEIDLALYNETPLHRDNFVKLVKEQHYDSLLFHRVIRDFMIQGGDPTSKNAAPGALLGEGDLGYSVKAEFLPERRFHKRGTLAAAREGDVVNPQRRSSSTQFYIVWGRTFTDEQLDAQQARISRATQGQVTLPDHIRQAYKTIGGTPHLDGQYTVFGHVVEGLEIVEKIQRTATDSLDRPVEDVRILKATVLE